MSEAHHPDQQTLIIDAEAVQALDKFDETLREGFAKALTEQPTRLDDLAKQLIALELAIPGLFAAVLKLASGNNANLQHSLPILLAFGCWLLALVFSFASLLPEKYQIDINSLTDIQSFFSESANRKLRLLIPSAALCFIGIGLVVSDIFLT